MSECFCEIISKTVKDEDGCPVTVYGIKYQGDKIICLPDLCTDEKKIRVLCEALSGEDVDSKALPYIIDDFLFGEL